MGRNLCPKCAKNFASVGKPCTFHSGATTGHMAAFGRYSNTTEQESQKECSASSSSNSPLLPNEVHMVEPRIHDRKRGMEDDQKCDRQSECALPDIYLEKSADVSALEAGEEKSSRNLHLPRNGNSSSDENYYEGYDVRKKAELDQEVQSSVESRRKIFKWTLPKKRLQECDKRNSKGSISYLLKCSFPNAYVESSINLATLEDRENSSKLSEGESVTSSVDSIAIPGPSGITKETNESKISAIASQFKLFKGESTTSSLGSLATPASSGITKKTNKSNISAKTSQSKLSEGESITSSVDSLASPGPSGITKKTNESKISAIASQFKLSKEESSTFSVDSLAIPGPSGITKKTNESNISAKTSQSTLSERESITSSVESFAAPGPSCITKKINESKISAKTSQSKSTFEDQSALEDKSKSICKKCKKEISDHVYILHERHLYKCCACNYRNANKFHLERHDYYSACQSILVFACNICDELMFDTNHGKTRQCAICGRSFCCVTQLENHTLVHAKNFKYCCWICGNKTSEHNIPDGKEFYKCCKCDYKGNRSGLRYHLFSHTDLRLFKCDLCDNRYVHKTSLVSHSHSHFTCKKCYKTFPNDKSLEEHDKKDHN